MRSLVALLLLLSTTSYAEDGVLIARIPFGATNEQVVSVMRQCLINRDWTITAIDANSVSASIKSPRGHAQIRLIYNNTSIIWDGSAKSAVGVINRLDTSNYTSNSHPIYMPKRWLKLLKKDISGILAMIPDNS